MIDIKKGIEKIVSEMNQYDDAAAETAEYFLKYSAKMSYKSHELLKIAFHAKLSLIKKDLAKKNNRLPVVFPGNDMHEMIYFDQFTIHDLSQNLKAEQLDIFKKYFFSGMTINELAALEKKSKSSIQRQLTSIREKMNSSETIDRNFYMSFFTRHGKTPVTQKYDIKPSAPGNTAWCAIGQKKMYSDSLSKKLSEKYIEGI